MLPERCGGIDRGRSLNSDPDSRSRPRPPALAWRSGLSHSVLGVQAPSPIYRLRSTSSESTRIGVCGKRRSTPRRPEIATTDEYTRPQLEITTCDLKSGLHIQGSANRFSTARSPVHGACPAQPGFRPAVLRPVRAPVLFPKARLSGLPPCRPEGRHSGDLRSPTGAARPYDGGNRFSHGPS